MDGEDTGQAGEGNNPEHLLLRRGQRQVADGAPGLVPRFGQCPQAAAVDEIQVCQVDDDAPVAGRRGRDGSRDARGG
jgi:hypothetical protein